MDVETRFMAKIRVSDTGCWEWIATRNQKGYGRFWADGRLWSAHRWSYEHFVGPIPDGLLACHTCDNPPCVNPSHLFPGTVSDNALDSQRKGRDGISGTGVSEFVGVTFVTKVVNGKAYTYWRARVNVAGRQVHIGQYPTELQAARAYDDFVRPLGLGKPLNDVPDAALSALFAASRGIAELSA